MMDSTGKKLTMDDIATGNYSGDIVNEQGAVGNVVTDEMVILL